MTEEVKLDREKCIRWILLLVLSLCSFVAITIDPNSTSLYEETQRGMAAFFSLLRDEMGEVSIVHSFAAAVLVWLYQRELLKKEGKKPFCLTACIVGAVLSFFLVLGISFSTYTNFDFFIYRKAQVPIAVITFIGYWGLLYTCLKILYRKLDELKVRSRTYSGILAKIDRHFLAVCIVALLVIWLIQILPFFPGSVPHDGRYQLNQYFGVTAMNTHHPYAATMIMGTIYSIGSTLFGTNGGAFLFVLFQCTCGAIVFGQICFYIKKKTGSLCAGFVSFAFFALAPMFWTYLQTIDKDAMYMITFAWFGLEYVKQVWRDGGKWGMLRLVLSAALICILRNEGCYIVIPALLVLVFILADKRKVAVLSLVFIIVWNYGWNTLYMDYLELEPANQVESISVCLQMVARYSLYYGDELTEEEQDIITAVVSYDGMAERYDPVNADPVKNKGYRDTTDEEWSAFWNLWMKLLLRHPLVYVEAAMNEIYGYLDPTYFYTGLTTYQLYNKENFSDYDEGITYSQYVFSSDLRGAVSDAVNSWREIPILSLIVCPGTYSWIGIIFLAALLRKRDIRNACIFITPLITILVCFASPVNGYLRYTLPIMAAMPLYILVGLSPYWKKEKIISVAELEHTDGSIADLGQEHDNG